MAAAAPSSSSGAERMSANGTNQTCSMRSRMSASGGKPDIDRCLPISIYEYTALLAFPLLLSVFPGIGRWAWACSTSSTGSVLRLRPIASHPSPSRVAMEGHLLRRGFLAFNGVARGPRWPNVKPSLKLTLREVATPLRAVRFRRELTRPTPLTVRVRRLRRALSGYH